MDEGVAAHREEAGVSAEIGVVEVAVVAGFDRIAIYNVPLVHDAIWAHLLYAEIRAAISRNSIPIIALLAVHRLKNAVTAAWKHLDHARGRTIVAVCRIAIIALFARLDSSIPADGRFGLTERVASISGSRIPVITLL